MSNPLQKQAQPSAANRIGNSVPENESRFTPLTVVDLPALNLPTGGGAIRGIEEKFQVNAITGTASLGISIPLTPSRQGFTPALGLTYNSGAGNSPFGLGWNIGIPVITRKTENKLPQYLDEEASDTFVLSGAEDLVPLLQIQNNQWIPYSRTDLYHGREYTVTRYRPRMEGAFAVIEKWQATSTGDTFWKTITKDNIHSLFGTTPENRITDPADNNRIFEWKLCRSYDDKGNITIYHYKKEDFADIPQTSSEKNNRQQCAQLYIKEVWYGNKQPYLPAGNEPGTDDFMFKVVFDYGEHDTADVPPLDVYLQKNTWNCRKDIFSTCRPGFKLRTYRRCSRILIFHCFPELPHSPYLTKSLQLIYDNGMQLGEETKLQEGFSFLVKARQNGHLWDTNTNTYRTKYLPETELAYEQHSWNTQVHNIYPEDIPNAPAGLADKHYMWTDLYNEGLSGILTEQGTGWYYMYNQGNGQFSLAEAVTAKPNMNGLAGNSAISIQELAGDGAKYLVQYQQQPKGYYKLNPDNQWEAFQPFEALPNIDLQDKNIRAIDLTGNGTADLLMTHDTGLQWFEGAGEKGFEVSHTLLHEMDEEKGPAIVFSDAAQCIFLADMSGDGLTDIVRIRNGEICYWPNMGYGKFGARVNMDNAPLFDSHDAFNPSFLRLADIDGSGTIDVIYLSRNEFRVWMNLSGNSWTITPQIITGVPEVSNTSDVQILDLLGTGTACIVWSSPLASLPVKYIDLMDSKKPGLLKTFKNNCGKELTLHYKPSTYYYLEDKKAGYPWITRLPFPVHCISSAVSEDKIRETVLTMSYRYRHGYFDPVEREFRGFARVEQLDTENFAAFKLRTGSNVVPEELHQPPVRTISWFHTGAYIRNQAILHQCAQEYFVNTQFNEYNLPAAIFPGNTSAEELREAYRACKGIPLRTEVYADDNSSNSAFPYSATMSNFEIKLVQPRGDNRYASFLLIPAETITYTYERVPADPRINHTMILHTDELGNTTKAVSIVYPRIHRPADSMEIPEKVWQEQQKIHISYQEIDYTDDVITADQYRLRIAYETRSFELGGITKPANFFFSINVINDVLTQINVASNGTIPFEEEFDNTPQKRLSRRNRMYFINSAFNGPLEKGKLSPTGILYKRYRMAFTQGLLTKHYGSKIGSTMLTNARYVQLDDDNSWWIQSGIALYNADPATDFYIPYGTQDAFGNISTVTYDPYFLLLNSSTNAIGCTSSGMNDYRVLSHALLTDSNMNRSMVETDELGLVIKSAIMGKEGSTDGDTLADPTAKMEYDLLNWQHNKRPNYVHIYMREQHGPSNTRWQETYVYSDGSGKTIMAKIQAKPGMAQQWNPETRQVETVYANPRWTGNGKTIINNKGLAVKGYDPFFSTNFDYETEAALVETGVSSVKYYDPTGRNTLTKYPDGTFSKIVFDAWMATSYDRNDTVKDSRWYVERGSPDPLTGPEPTDADQRAAWLAAKHHNTPSRLYANSCGMGFYSVTNHGGGKVTHAYSEQDPMNRYVKKFDQLNRNVHETYYNMLQTPMYARNAEKGEKWIFSDVIGRPVLSWNREQEQWATFDPLHRIVDTYLKEGNSIYVTGHAVYADTIFDEATAISKNIKGRLYRLYNQGGTTTVKQIDFRGRTLALEQRLIKDYTAPITDWNILTGLNDLTDIDNASNVLLETEIFSSNSVLDAMSRPVTVTLPDSTVYKPLYDEANQLDNLTIQLRGQGDFIPFMLEQDHNARGQRVSVKYGNDSVTSFLYDANNFRLINLITRRSTDNSNEGRLLQDINYTYDPVGNIMETEDLAQQTVFFKNSVVLPQSRYEYDATYQLIKATGRELASHGIAPGNQDLAFIPQLPHNNDLTALQRYTETYEYDDLGNIKTMRHTAGTDAWVRKYRYNYEDDLNNATCRLKSTSRPGDNDTGPFSDTYEYDSYGNMTSMPHLAASGSLIWNYKKQLRQVNLGGGGTAYYQYGAGKERIRKIIKRPGGKIEERIYLGAVEIYRERQDTQPPSLERYTIMVFAAGKIAEVDIKTIDINNSDPSNPLNTPLIRYQYSNLLGSAMLEADASANILSYEEYHPYGTSAYRSCKSDTNLSIKRYRFSGKERDDETGLYYFGARYYAAWLGRWTSSDPAGFVSGNNMYRYCSNNPISRQDPDGKQDLLIGVTKDNLKYKNPAMKDEAKAYIEGVATKAAGGGVYNYVIDNMKWTGEDGWEVTECHWEPKTDGTTDDVTSGSDEGSAAETAAASSGEATPEASPPADTDGGVTDGIDAGNTTAASEQPGGSGTAPQASSGSGEGRNYLTKSFWGGLIAGILSTLAIIAVVASLPITLPTAAVATLAVAGIGMTAAGIIQSVRQRDLFNNPISEDDANFNLGFNIGGIIGGLGGGSFAGPTSGAGTQGIRSLQPAFAGGGADFGGAIAISGTHTVTATATGVVASNVVMMAASGSSGSSGSGSGSGSGNERGGSDYKSAWNEFYDLDDAIESVLGKDIKFVGKVDTLDEIKSEGVKASIKAAGLDPNDFTPVLYKVLKWNVDAKKWDIMIINIFESEGGVFFGPHISSSTYTGQYN